MTTVVDAIGHGIAEGWWMFFETASPSRFVDADHAEPMDAGPVGEPTQVELHQIQLTVPRHET